MAARVEDGDDHVPLVLLRLGLCPGQHLLGLLEVDRGAIGNLGRRRRHRLLGANGNRREQQYRHDNQRQKPCHPHGVSSYWKADVEGMTAADDMAAWGAERLLRPARAGDSCFSFPCMLEWAAGSSANPFSVNSR